MSKMLSKTCFVFFVLVYIHQTSSFNIDTLLNSTDLIKPYQVLDSSQIPTNPIFFGYNFNFRMRSGSTSSIVVGAPKRRSRSNALPQSGSPQPSNVGGIFTCAVMSSAGPSCEPIGVPLDTKRGDAYGLTVDFDNFSDSLVACSPTKQQICGRSNEVINLPGYCYNRDVNSATWSPDSLTRELRCPILSRDIIFLVDGSGSIGRGNFETIQNWIINLASNFNINNGDNRIGVIQYSHYFPNRAITNQRYIRTEIALGSSSNQQSFNNAVLRIQYQNFTTYTAAALRKTALDFQASRRFNDPNTAKVLILLTDGNSTDSENLDRDAQAIRDLGIITFAVGVSGANVQELRTVATGDLSSGKRVFFVENFEDLDEIVSRLANEISSNNLEGAAIQEGNETNGFTLGEYGISLHRSLQKTGDYFITITQDNSFSFRKTMLQLKMDMCQLSVNYNGKDKSDSIQEIAISGELRYRFD